MSQITTTPTGGTPSNPNLITAAEALEDIIKNAANERPKQFRVTLMKDSALVVPELWLDVWVEGDKYEQSMFSNWLIKAKCNQAKSPERADLVIFTGGTDVDPTLYGEVPMREVETPDKKRDAHEMKLYLMCVENGIPMLGICRGAQFLAVMNGAKLFQHVDNHNKAHAIWDVRRKVMVSNASSVHHQMVMADVHGGMEVIADAMVAKNRWIREGVNRAGTFVDVEAFWYRDTCSLGIQGHPEYQGYAEFSQWCLEVMRDCFLENTDLALQQIDDTQYKYRRVKPEFLLERKHVLKLRNDTTKPKQPHDVKGPNSMEEALDFDVRKWDLITDRGEIVLGHGCTNYTEYAEYARMNKCTIEKMEAGGCFIPSGALLVRNNEERAVA